MSEGAHGVFIICGEGFNLRQASEQRGCGSAVQPLAGWLCPSVGCRDKKRSRCQAAGYFSRPLQEDSHACFIACVPRIFPPSCMT